MSTPSYFHYHSSIVELEVSDGNASRGSFIVQDCFGYPVVCLFVFHMKLSIALSRSVKNRVRILMGITLNL